ncbi:MAG TPA: ATP-dependent DNA helicase RecG [Thermoanaerobaculales bacterium]|nr:ATP-dependent DNA helicase RecG [Thermoanaerobaculales bacterium]HQL30735.1 ATP-dependent DNA helicase RecG [Thermoanaerobaculales bacterium]HQN95381.1 ATP-dependent DNA helicase RecG [Thermoanaerobaculales bacterium]
MTRPDRTPSPFATVDALRGIGPRLAAALGEHGVTRVVDLLLHLPARYEDRTQRVDLGGALAEDARVLVWGRVAVGSARHTRRRGLRIVTGVVDDGSGTLPVVWFNQPWIDRRLEGARPLSLYGQLRRGRRGGLELVNPEVNDIEDGGAERIVPVYPRLGPLGGRRLRRLIEQALPALGSCPDPLPAELRDRLGLPGLAVALGSLHDPEPPAGEPERVALVDALCRRETAAHRRLAFQELLAFACGLAEHRSRRERQAAPRCRRAPPVDELARAMFRFELTSAQRRVIQEIADDLGRPHPMARLVQGDVGCGKTAVAALAMRLVLDSGHQAALMAPTELLAEQHARTLAGHFRSSGYRVTLLSSSQPAAERRQVIEDLADGSERLVVGTHALIQAQVAFRELGLVVVDEQHRFGVMQRQSLLDKGREPHLLVMTATPIPRSLALTLYGDLDLSIIDELPPGRTPVTTVVRASSAAPKVFAFLRDELAAGGRAFLVYPTIEGADDSALPSLERRAAEVAAALPGVALGVVHGRMPRADREAVTERFRRGDVQALLTTTVVEVGIDVPEASVVVVEGAESFGLSQLHQLRGRVGRGDRRSWCILVTGEDTGAPARRRLETLAGSSDGFAIAEVDLELRGPGELTGLRQWGPAGFRFADLLRHAKEVALARDAARGLAAEGRLAATRAELARYHRIESELPAG